MRPAVEAHLAGVREARVRVVLHRDGAVEVTLAPLPRDDGPVVLAPPLLADPVDAAAYWPHHKTTDREPYARRLAAARRSRSDADDVVLVNTAGELTETTIASLAVRLDDRWCTPPLGGGALPGVGRAVLVERGDLVERVLHPDDLERASGLAVRELTARLAPGGAGGGAHAPRGASVTSARRGSSRGSSPSWSARPSRSHTVRHRTTSERRTPTTVTTSTSAERPVGATPGSSQRHLAVVGEGDGRLVDDLEPVARA